MMKCYVQRRRSAMRSLDPRSFIFLDCSVVHTHAVGDLQGIATKILQLAQADGDVELLAKREGAPALGWMIRDKIRRLLAQKEAFPRAEKLDARIFEFLRVEHEAAFLFPDVIANAGLIASLQDRQLFIGFL